MLAVQVEARYCNFFGLVHEYRIWVLDEVHGDFPVDGVPPDQIRMHFLSGSRVNIKWRQPSQVSVAATSQGKPPCTTACQSNVKQAGLWCHNQLPSVLTTSWMAGDGDCIFHVVGDHVTSMASNAHSRSPATQSVLSPTLCNNCGGEEV